MPDHVLQPSKVGVVGRRRSVLPAHIIQKLILSPAGKVEGRIRHNEIRLELRVTVIKECVRAELSKVSFDTANGKIHLRQLPCGGVGVLTIHRDVFDISAVIFDELRGLDKHTARPAAGVVDTAIVWL